MKNLTVLIIEDDEWAAEQYGRVIQKSGYKVKIAHHAYSAIEMLDKYKIDVIILDVLLAGSTAFALLNELQSYEDLGKIQVILCTNIASDLSKSKLGEYGVRRILDKTTMEPSDLVAAVRGVLL